MIYQSDVLILPSLFEGTSRAILIFIYRNTRILRNTNDNFNLISNLKTVYIFDNDEDLIKKLFFFMKILTIMIKPKIVYYQIVFEKIIKIF